MRYEHQLSSLFSSSHHHDPHDNALSVNATMGGLPFALLSCDMTWSMEVVLPGYAMVLRAEERISVSSFAPQRRQHALLPGSGLICD